MPCTTLFISNRFNYISFQERIQGVKYELLDVRRTHFYCWVHWKYETKSQQKPLLSTHLGGKKPTEITMSLTLAKSRNRKHL